MAKIVTDTSCLLCNFSLSLPRGQDIADCTRFDPDEDIENKMFIRFRHSLGRAKGLVIDGGLTLEQATKDPQYKPVIDRLHARVTRLKAYLDELNK